MDDLILHLLPADENQLFFARRNLWISIPLFTLVIPAICFCLYITPTMIIMQSGRIKFSMEPIAYTGLDLLAQAGAPAVPPSFNVMLHVKSTYDWFKFCSSGQPPMMEVIYSGVTIAKTAIELFCVDVKGEKVIVATTMSLGWPPLPKVFHERMESDRRLGGVHMEVDFIYNNEHHTSMERTWWVRCRTTLDVHKPFPCSSYIVQGYFED
jgi:hypothetical protein